MLKIITYNLSMKIKISDIARKANVSNTTVSLVLNNRLGVGHTTRKKVLEIAKDIGYEISKTEAKINFTKKGIIKFYKISKHGHTVNRDHDVFIADYIFGLNQEARRRDYVLEVSYMEKIKSVKEIIKSIDVKRNRGIIILGTELDYDDIQLFTSVNIPLGFIDTYYESIGYDFVDMNNTSAVFKIVKHLSQSGHKKIGFINANTEVRNFRLRETALKKAFDFFNINYNREFVYSVDSTFTGSYNDMLKILQKTDKLPTALFSSNDIIAYGCIKALKEKNYLIPEDISIIGFDDLPMSSLMDPPLTTINVSKKRIGEVSMNLMINRIQQNNLTQSEKVLVGGKLIVRNSVKNIQS